MIDATYHMMFEEVRRALDELRQGRHAEALQTLEGITILERFVEHFRRRDSRALRMAAILRQLEWEMTPEGRLLIDREKAWNIEGTKLGEAFERHLHQQRLLQVEREREILEREREYAAARRSI
jgi:hypothetical protein